MSKKEVQEVVSQDEVQVPNPLMTTRDFNVIVDSMSNPLMVIHAEKFVRSREGDVWFMTGDNVIALIAKDKFIGIKG